MSSELYRAILFDLDDTLFSLRGCEAQALQRVVGEAGLLPVLPADFKETYAAISSRYWAARATDGFTQSVRAQVLELSWRDFLSKHGLDAGRAEQLANQYWAAFCRSSVLTPDAPETLERLSRQYRLGVISNGYVDSQRGRLEASALARYFDPIVISEEVGVAKPDARIFQLALDQLGLPAEAALYIGDSISHDREGCRRAGVDFCHFCPGSGDVSELPPVKFRIRHLSELTALLIPLS